MGRIRLTKRMIRPLPYVSVDRLVRSRLVSSFQYKLFHISFVCFPFSQAAKEHDARGHTRVKPLGRGGEAPTSLPRRLLIERVFLHHLTRASEAEGTVARRLKDADPTRAAVYATLFDDLVRRGAGRERERDEREGGGGKGCMVCVGGYMVKDADPTRAAVYSPFC
jgi:hypothetical protein